MSVSDALRRHFGLVKPYRFERTLSLMGAIFLGITVVAAASALWLRDDSLGSASRGLSWGTPRCWYFLYITSLVLLGGALAPRPRIAAVVLSLAALEIGFGFGSAALYKAHLAKSANLFPNDYVRPRLIWHPLLQVVPQPTSPREADRGRVFINSKGMRGPERTQEQLRGKIVIALFGASTTIEYGTPDGQSWGERLERALGPDRYAIINHGVPGYTSAELVIQAAFYAMSHGVEPHCALYYIGWNDLSNAHIDGLDPGYADFHMVAQVDAFGARRLDYPYLDISPTLKLLARFAILGFDTIRPNPNPPGRPRAGPDTKLEEIYLRNIEAISAINRQRGITTIWISQVMNEAELQGETIHRWSPFLSDKDYLSSAIRLNRLLREKAKSLGDIYVDIPLDDFKQADFSDEVHFSPKGSAKFASHLVSTVSNACRLGAHR